MQLQFAPRPSRTANNFKSRKYEPIDEVDDFQEWVDTLAPVWDYFREQYGAEGEALIELATKY